MLKEKNLTNTLIFVIFLAGFVLRVWGLGFGLPHLYHADEPIVVNHALAYGAGDLNPHFFKIPPLASYMLFFAYGIFYLAGLLSGRFQGVADFERLFYSDPSLFYLLGRFLIGVVPGTIGLFLVYCLTKRHFTKAAALIAAALFAFSFLPVRDSHYIYVDSLLVAALLAALYFILRICEPDAAGDIKLHLIAGFWIGAATAIKYNGVFLLLPYLGALWGAGKKKQALAFCLGAGVICLLTFFLLNPFSLLDWKFFLSEIAAQSKANSEGTRPLHHLSYSLAGALGIPFLAAAVGGGIMGLMAFSQPVIRQKMLVLVLFVLFYYGILVLKGQPYDRYVLPLIPFLTIMAAFFIQQISGAGKRLTGLFLSSLVFLIIFSFPAAKTFLLLRIINEKDVRTVAREWILQHIPAGRAVVLDIPFYMPRLRYAEAQLIKKREIAEDNEHFGAVQERRIDHYLNRERKEKEGYELYFFSEEERPDESFLFSGPFLPYGLNALREKKIDYTLLAGGVGPASKRSFPDDLRREAREIIVFSPYKDPLKTEPYDKFTLTGLPFTWSELVNRDRNGIPIVLYRLDHS